MFFSPILILVLGLLALIMYSIGAGKAFKDLLIVWVLGLLAIGALSVLLLFIAQWSPMAGLLIFLVAALYVVDWMLKRG